MPKPTHKEVWQKLLDEAGEDQVDRAAKVTPEEAAKELRAAGVDVEAERAKANAFLADLEEGTEKAALKEEGERVEAPTDEALDASLAAKLLAQRAPANVVSLTAERGKRKRSAASIALIAAAAAALVLGGGGAAYVALRTPPPAPGPSSPTPTAPPAPPPEEVAKHDAENLRKLAVADCNDEKWDECLARLGKAEELDPAGDHVRTVVRLRAKARRGRLADSVELKAFPDNAPRSLTGAELEALTATLRASGQKVQIVCAPGAEPGHVCDQLASTLAKAGWVVSRSRLSAEEAAMHGVRIDVATDADDSTQAAADALADGLAVLAARGPDDMPPDTGGAPLRITVGAR
jgi:hypothetical protein